MNPIMADLHTDHRNFAKLISILEDLVNDFEHDNDPDLYLMLDIIDYVERYPDLTHHPKEEIIFKKYLTKTHTLPEVVNKLQRDHEELPEMRREIRQLLEDFINDVGLYSRKEFSQKLRTYMECQLNHLNTEEQKLFPHILETLSQEDWDEIASEIPDANDPLFGKDVKDNYKNLFAYIVNQ